MDGGQEGEARVARSFPVWLSLTSLFSGDLLPHEIASHHRLQKERLTPGPALALSRMVNVRDPHFQPPPPQASSLQGKTQVELSRMETSREMGLLYHLG